MKVDQSYVKEVLNAFLDSPRAFVWVDDILKRGIEMDDRFLFHMQILEDQGLVECLDKRSDLGYEINLGGAFTWQSRPLRLTAAGHELAEAMNRREIWEILKGEFTDASLSTLKAAATTLLVGFAKKQIGKYVEL